MGFAIIMEYLDMLDAKLFGTSQDWQMIVGFESEQISNIIWW